MNTCLFCNSNLSGFESFSYIENPFHPYSITICNSCACIVHNLYVSAHGGTAEWEENYNIKNKKKKIPSNLRWEIFERDGYKCLECGSKRNLSIDHIIPEIKGGGINPGNLQTLCVKCNLKKGAR